MKDLLPLAEKVGTLLKARCETIAISESSAGGLVSAALLTLPGASAYFLGGVVVYTRAARETVGGQALIAAELACVVNADTDAARATARRDKASSSARSPSICTAAEMISSRSRSPCPRALGRRGPAGRPAEVLSSIAGSF